MVSKLEVDTKSIMLGSRRLKLFLRIIFKNIENIILMSFENISCSLILVYFVFSMLKKKERN